MRFRRRRRKFLRIQLEISRNPCTKHGGFLFISSCILKKFACGGEISYFRLFPSCSLYFRVSTRTKYFLHDFSPYYSTEFLRELNIFISEFLRELFFARFYLYFRVFFLQLLRELNWGKSPAAGLKIIILQCQSYKCHVVLGHWYLFVCEQWKCTRRLIRSENSEIRAEVHCRRHVHIFTCNRMLYVL